MNGIATELQEKIRQQFETGPYPRVPLEKSPKNNASLLYIHNLVTAYYLRNQKVIDTEGKLILDAGCGSGYKSLVLAEANPGAKVIGVDISEKSTDLARQRLQHHGFHNAEFYPLLIEELPQLDLKFDYINCDEVLYLLPDSVAGLQAMQSVLKPEGIIRANLHSSIARSAMYRAQEVFQMMGLMDGNPADMEIALTRETLKALKNQVILKQSTWKPEYDNNNELVLANYLLQGDKGSTIPEVFAAVRAANLELFSMVNWRRWDLMELFQEPENLPAFLDMSLPEATLEERLHLFELLHPVHRLLDFWCGHPDRSQFTTPVVEWTMADWQAVRVHIHPQLRQPKIKEKLISCIERLQQFEIGKHLAIQDGNVSLDSLTAACLLPLWEEAQSMRSLVERWQRLKPLDFLTLEPTREEKAWEILSSSLTELESLGFILLERY